MLRAILFDLGDTLIYEHIDDVYKLDEIVLLHLQPHAKEVLESLSHHYKLGLITDTETSPETSVRKALSKVGIEPFFSAIVTSTDIGVRKPDPQIFHETLRRLNVKPNESAMVGNNIECDIVGAKQLGIISILYRNSKYYKINDEKFSDYFIDSLDEIPLLIAKLDK